MSANMFFGILIAAVMGLFLLGIAFVVVRANQCAALGGEQIPHVGCVTEGSDGTLRRVR